MRRNIITAVLLFVAAGWVNPGFAASDWNAVATALGKSGTEMPGGIYRVGLPRSDLTVTLDGVTLKPSLALGSWLAFVAMGKKAVVMGDLVLTEDEVSPVMKQLADGRIEITALHNHLFRARPMTFYMHVRGEGDAVHFDIPAWIDRPRPGRRKGAEANAARAIYALLKERYPQ